MLKRIVAKLRRKRRKSFNYYAENATLYRLRGDIKMAKIMEGLAKEELKK
jgi:hypothetical protein